MRRTLEISLYDGNAEKWDSFVCEHKASTFFHQMGWKNVVENTYGHKPFYLAASEGGEIKGVLPLFLMRHFLFGRFMVSIPFGDCCGICADNGDTAKALLIEAIKFTKETRARFLELRHIEGMRNKQLLTKTSRASLILQLKRDSEQLWANLRKEMRRHVRKAWRSGLESDIGNETLLADFYEVFAYHMRELGTPVHSLLFFQNILREFPQHTNVIIIRLKGKAIGACIAIHFRDMMEIPWASSLGKFHSLRPNNLLFWTAIEHGCKEGYGYLNFGRSPWNSGTFQFKKQWGAEPVQLHYQYYLSRASEMPDYTPSTNSRFNSAIWLWKKLPFSLTKLIGPRIISGIPY